MTKSDATKWLSGLIRESGLGPEFKDILLTLALPAILELLYKHGGEVIGPDAKEN